MLTANVGRRFSILGVGIWKAEQEVSKVVLRTDATRSSAEREQPVHDEVVNRVVLIGGKATAKLPVVTPPNPRHSVRIAVGIVNKRCRSTVVKAGTHTAVEEQQRRTGGVVRGQIHGEL